MKKLLLSWCLVVCCFFVQPAAAGGIPYPDGYVRGGAAAAAGQGDWERSPYFTNRDFYTMNSGGSLLLLEKFRTYQQTTEWSCGNAAALMVLRHFGDQRYDELTLAAMMGTRPLPEDGKPEQGVLYGTTTAGLAGFFKKIGYDVASSLEDGEVFRDELTFRAWLTAQIEAKKPVMVDWLDWNGHWQVIIGYDTLGTDTMYDDVLIFADPYDVGDHRQDGYYIFPALRFYYMWQDFLYQPQGRGSRQWVVAAPPILCRPGKRHQ